MFNLNLKGKLTVLDISKINCSSSNKNATDNSDFHSTHQKIIGTQIEARS